MRQQRLFFPVLAFVLATVSACGGGTAPKPTSLVERTHDTMGSELRLTAATDAEDEAVAAFDAAFAEVDRLDGLMSVWKPGSEILQVNAAAGDHAVPVGPEVREVLALGRQFGDWTDGAFDVTFGALSGLWKFDAQNQDNSIPTRAEIERRLPFINYRDVELDETAGTAFVKRKGVSTHLGGIGKGYAVDRVVDILRRAGIHDFMVQFGGDLYLSGERGDRPWRAAIRDPRGPADQPFAVLDLTDETLSTSGDYERFFIADGRRYHHIIDPGTGEPASGCRSVTIVAKRAVVADALSTGVFVMGPREGMALIERLPDVEGVIVSSSNEVLVSSGLKTRLTLLAQPTDAP